MKLLWLDSSILGDNSVSRKVSAAIVDRVKAQNPGIETVYRDLVAEPLSHLTPGDMVAAAGENASAESRAILAEFLAADIVVIGAPMYNFTVPSQLKAWIDRILVAGHTFRYGPNGPEGLVAGKRIIAGLARGSVYASDAPAAGYEHLQTYLGAVFGFIGAQPEFVIAEGVAQPERREAAIAEALASAAKI